MTVQFQIPTPNYMVDQFNLTISKCFSLLYMLCFNTNV